MDFIHGVSGNHCNDNKTVYSDLNDCQEPGEGMGRTCDVHSLEGLKLEPEAREFRFQ